MILAGGSTSLLFWAPTIAWAVAFRMIAGLGSAFFSVSRHFYLTEMTPLNNRGRILSTFGGIFRFGRLLGPLAGGTVAALFGLRASFLSFGLVCLIALLVVVFYLPHIEVMGQSAPGGVKPKGSLFAYTLRTQFRTLSTAGLGYLFMQMVRSGPVTMIPLYGTFVLNLDVQTLGLITGFSSGLDMLLFYPAGMLMDRWGRKYAMISSCIFLSAGLALIPFMQSGLLCWWPGSSLAWATGSARV